MAPPKGRQRSTGLSRDPVGHSRDIPSTASVSTASQAARDARQMLHEFWSPIEPLNIRLTTVALGLYAYVVVRALAAGFYSNFGLSPERVGLTYIDLLPAAAFLFFLIGSVGLGFAFRWAAQEYWTGDEDSRDWYTAFRLTSESIWRLRWLSVLGGGGVAAVLAYVGGTFAIVAAAYLGFGVAILFVAALWGLVRCIVSRAARAISRRPQAKGDAVSQATEPVREAIPHSTKIRNVYFGATAVLLVPFVTYAIGAGVGSLAASGANINQFLLLPVRAHTVQVSTSPLSAVSRSHTKAFPQRCEMLLGEHDGVTWLWDVKLKRLIHLPTDQITLTEVNGCGSSTP